MTDGVLEMRVNRDGRRIDCTLVGGEHVTFDSPVKPFFWSGSDNGSTAFTR